jgi:phosphoribosylamine--glycine ligase
MRVLVIGSGAREHAIVSRLAAEPECTYLACAPGGPGIARIAHTIPADISQPEALLAIAEQQAIDLTVVGPELPLAQGVADRFADAGRLILGPTAAAARLETSKSFAKAFMARHAVPTARYAICDSLGEALAVIDAGLFPYPLVLKADGLAAGKGVVIAPDRAAAEEASRAAMAEHRFGAAGDRLVIEECLTGPEVSFFVLSDGTRALTLGTAQDHKRIFDDDLGPNTGGMGAFAPSPLIDDRLTSTITDRIVQPVLAGMRHEGYPFRGFLYVGLMLTPAGPQVIEFNARLGDPETQVVLPLIDEPLLPLLTAAASGRLGRETCAHSNDKLVGVVLASHGYPESARSGDRITGLDDAEAQPMVLVYHAGTADRDGHLVTAGGRVLTVVGRGPSYADAMTRAYAGAACITFDGMQYRRDIGKKAVRERAL